MFLLIPIIFLNNLLQQSIIQFNMLPSNFHSRFKRFSIMANSQMKQADFPNSENQPIRFNSYFRVTVPPREDPDSSPQDTRPVVGLWLSEAVVTAIQETWYVYHSEPHCWENPNYSGNRWLRPHEAKSNQERRKLCWGKHTNGHAYPNDFVHNMRQIGLRRGWDVSKLYVDFKSQPEMVLIFAENAHQALNIAHMLALAVCHWMREYPYIFPHYYNGIIRVTTTQLSLDSRYFLDAANTLAATCGAITEDGQAIPEILYDMGIKPEMIEDHQRMYDFEKDAFMEGCPDDLIQYLHEESLQQTRELQKHMINCFGPEDVV